MVNHPESTVRRRDLFRFRTKQGPRNPTGSNPPLLQRVNGGDLLLARRPAMGSYFEVRLPARTPGGALLAQSSLDLIDQIELQLTIYRADSTISRLNDTADQAPVEVNGDLFDLIRHALQIGEETAGAYDLASGALSQAWGFVKGPKRVPSREELDDAKRRSGSHLLRLDPERRTIFFERPGVVLNFGSIGKGYAIDRVADQIRSWWLPVPALIQGGQSSLLAIGSPPGTIDDEWNVAVRNPFDPDRPLGMLKLRDRALATSGSAFQWFQASGRFFSHILDTRTGEPLGVDAPASVTVLAPTAAEADALATAFSVLGPEKSAEILGRRPELAALFVVADDHPERQTDQFVEARCIGINLSDHDFQPETLASDTNTS